MTAESARAAVEQDLREVERLARMARSEVQEQRGGALWAALHALGEPLGEALRQALDSDRQHLAVGVIDGAVVGYAVMSVLELRDRSRLGRIDELYVEPAAREVGVGEALLDHIFELCRACGCDAVDALALPGDRPTKNFFERAGMVSRALIVHRSLRPTQADPMTPEVP